MIYNLRVLWLNEEEIAHQFSVFFHIPRLPLLLDFWRKLSGVKHVTSRLQLTVISMFPPSLSFPVISSLRVTEFVWLRVLNKMQAGHHPTVAFTWTRNKHECVVKCVCDKPQMLNLLLQHSMTYPDYCNKLRMFLLILKFDSVNRPLIVIFRN